jgi:glycosyltransferase involved in cell wall biosynthesis
VDDNLRAFSNIPGSEGDYSVINIFGFQLFYSPYANLLCKFDVVFTIFGPLYIFRKPYKSIVGFAQAWIIYPNNECYKMLPVIDRFKMRLKYLIQGFFFKRADELVVELEHVKQGLINQLSFPAERIHVIHNCISSIYLNDSLWHPVLFPPTDGFLRLGFIGRNYIHKNTVIFPKVVSELALSHGIVARFFVTFTEKEWTDCSPEFRSVCINVGPLAVAQCPKFYEALDAVVFPSLLECFSVTPLEALAMQKTLFASDRPFNRDICGPHAHYFDPLAPSDAAKAIANVFGGLGPDPDALLAGREHAIHFSNPKERAEKYLALLMGDAPAV